VCVCVSVGGTWKLHKGAANPSFPEMCYVYAGWP